MIYFADGLRVYVGIALAWVIWLAQGVLRPYWRRAFQKGTSTPRHVVKVASSHIGCLVLLGVDNLSEFGTDPSPSLYFVFVLSTLSVSSLIDLIRARRHG